jgi:hypothetical protein
MIPHPDVWCACSQFDRIKRRRCMSVRPPQNFRQSFASGPGFNALEYELSLERASALGHQGRKVEAALAELKACDASRQSQAQRDDLLKKASYAVWIFFIQREICGLRNSRDVIERYAIPAEVLARLGAM